MDRFDILQVSADPLFSPTFTATLNFTVNVTDNDPTLSDPDGDGSPQFDTTGLPGGVNSANTQVFELYTATVGGQPVEFILIRFSAPPLIVVTQGTINPGDTITGAAISTFTAPPIDYDDIPSFICFCGETKIRTASGNRPARSLKAGDYVAVKDGRLLPIRWIAKRRIGPNDLINNGRLRRVIIRAGAIGPNMPRADIRVSRQHRILLRSDAVALWTGQAEALVAAVKLLGLPGVEIDQSDAPFEYVHFMFDAHEVVDAEGLWTESLYLGKDARAMLPDASLQEIAEIFPGLLEDFDQISSRHEIPDEVTQRAIIAHGAQRGSDLFIE